MPRRAWIGSEALLVSFLQKYPFATIFTGGEAGRCAGARTSKTGEPPGQAALHDRPGPRPRHPRRLAYRHHGHDPHAGGIFCFGGRRGDLVTTLRHDGVGMSLHAKRLEAGTFLWPVNGQGEVVRILAAQPGYPLEGGRARETVRRTVPPYVKPAPPVLDESAAAELGAPDMGAVAAQAVPRRPWRTRHSRGPAARGRSCIIPDFLTSMAFFAKGVVAQRDLVLT